LDIPEGLFLSAEFLLQAVFELAQDALEVVLVFEHTSTLFADGMPDELKRIRNTIGEFAVI
jgi:hypothetical protein